MKKLIIAAMFLAIGYLGFCIYEHNNVPEPAYAGICFLTGERVSGMNKICYYDCLSGTTAITISSISLCPMSINN